MRAALLFFTKVLILMASFVMSSSLWAEESRLALIIGNSDYAQTPLLNPQNDANDMADVLQDLGFEVMLYIDADRREMAKAIRNFGRKLKKDRGIGLFYYAGHGMQLDNRNYLIPVGTPLEEEDEVPYESIDVGSVLAKMESAGNSLNVLILDACRNDPFPGQFRSSSRGLARVKAPVGSLVVYATAPGDVAADGNGRNGVFTGALLEQLREEGLSLSETIRRTRAAVVKETNGQQVPWESSSMMQDYFLSKPSEPDVAATPIADATSPESSAGKPDISAADERTWSTVQDGDILNMNTEIVFWNSVQSGNSAAEYQAYLNRFPDGLFADLATVRLEAVSQIEQESGKIEPEIGEVEPEPGKVKQESEQAASAQAAEVAITSENVELEPIEENSEPIQLATLETNVQIVPEVASTSTSDELASLTVDVSPADARVRIMNIIDKYAPGIQLSKSRSYDVYVTSPGYKSFREMVTLEDENHKIAVTLPKREVDALVLVPLIGGTFKMGCSSGDRLCEPYEKPAHNVAVSSFAMARTEVTVSQFARFVDAEGYRTDAERNAGGHKGCYVWSDAGGISRSAARWEWKADANWKNPGYPQKADFPVTCVSWNDANAYAEWISSRTGEHYSLPSEAQWEYAARAGAASAYGPNLGAEAMCTRANVADKTRSPSGAKWSDRIDCTDNNWFSAAVSSYKPNSVGLYDMQGNVWEWVADTWAGSFKGAKRTEAPYLSGSRQERVLRGGGWNGDAKRVRLSSRSKGDASSRASMTGFRLVVNRNNDN